jgi:hypothetical protein
VENWKISSLLAPDLSQVHIGHGMAFILCLLAAQVLSFAADYYVSPDGNDNGPGTSERTAWRTLARVNRADLSPGDRVLLEGGAEIPGPLVLEANDSGAEGNPVVVASFGSGRATIAAGKGFGLVGRNVSFIDVRDLVVTGSGATTNHGSGIAFVSTMKGAERPRGVRIEHIEAKGFARDLRRVADHTAGSGIYVGSASAAAGIAGYRDVVIRDCDAHHNEFFGILTWGGYSPNPDLAEYANENIVIVRCRAYENPGDPNHLPGHSGSGILLSNAQASLIEESEAWSNGALCRSKAGGPVGIWAYAADRVTIRKCKSHHNRSVYLDGGGFDFDGGVSNSVMEDNESYENAGAGYLLYVFAGSPYRFRNNIVRRCTSRNDGKKTNHRSAVWIRDDGNGISDILLEDNLFEYSPSGHRDDAGVYAAKVTRLTMRRNTIIVTGRTPPLRVEQLTEFRNEDAEVAPAAGTVSAIAPRS